jgi:tRNA pseudouridine32 synthase/23S rRNA pseudouridine746 synthase
MQSAKFPTVDGVSASCIATPHGSWPSMLDFLALRIPAVTRDEWAARMNQGKVLDDHGRPVTVDAPFQAQCKLYYWRSLPFEHKVPFDERVVFQDDYLVIADKPHFLPVTPTGRYVPMHRIDRETAGLVAFTVQPHTRDAYQALFRDKLVSKTYEAIARLNPDISLPMRHRSRLVESEHFMAMQEADGPVNAETDISLIESTAGWGRFRLQPITGQKHQLRVHMCALGMPIVGDQIYPRLLPAPPPDVAPNFDAPLMLLAQSLSFKDPVTGQQRDFHCERGLSLQAHLARHIDHDAI